ncbi:2-keto-4-pentenoate hydratase [Acuticoccus mangrovi]|uniref:Fumarylacetoacetate hydrolase family protein n=1 Tax=Acuticoccus mangrovi TaxID=2796142 RepID=A0A934ISH7_9HYPH|nr:fumarylacetoacetate hydrolase family protein [Acuticoccus mangrovi]MBJ3777905.1 fumarylacetoacetate hydrolase family protein [Acuticoccus mangrovi]
MNDAASLAAAFKGAGPIAELENKPADVVAGYALQDAVRAALGGAVIGWKLAQTTPAAQAAAGIDAPTVAPLLDGMIFPADHVFPAKAFYKPEAEAEIALELAAPIEGPVSPDEVFGACAGFRLAIEIADTRYVDKPAMVPSGVIADMNSCGALIVGPLMAMDGYEAAVSAPVTTQLGGGGIVESLPPEGRPDPLAVVSFLSHFVTERGETLPAGMIITTGTHTKPTPTGPGLVIVEFEGVGKVAARLDVPWS